MTWHDGKSIAEIVYELAAVRGDLSDQYARDQLVSIIEGRIRAGCVETERQVRAAVLDALGDDAAQALRDAVLDTSRMLDGSYPADLDSEANLWRRCAKITEENGEVTEALLGMLGENPRKGVTGGLSEVRAELLDVANCALGAWAHTTGNDGDPVAALAEHSASKRARLRAALDPEAGQ